MDNSSPSIYLPRQHRPRQAHSQNSELVTVQNSSPAMASKGSGTTRAGFAEPGQQPLPADLTHSNPHPAKNHTVAVSNTSNSQWSAISISGQLGTQIRRFLDQTDTLRKKEPSVGAFLLGYSQGDSTIYLNMLDQGVLVAGKRIPTAAYSDDVVVPLFYGASKLEFYSHIFRHGRLHKVAGWISEHHSDRPLVIEFASTRMDMWVLVRAESTTNIGSFSLLIDDLRRDNNIDRGSLSWDNKQKRYEYNNSLIIPQEHAIWISATYNNPIATVSNAYLEAGAPESLLVVQINASENALLPRTQSYRVEPSRTGKSALYIRLGSVQFPDSNLWSACTAKLLSPEQYSKGITGTLSTIVENNGMVYSATNSEKSLVHSPLEHRVSPFIQKIAVVTRASPGGDSFRLHTALDTKTSEATAEAARPYEIAALLDEQRSIRELLQEQNSLIRTQVSQTQEMMRLMKHQPSPQTVTRRYLRMRGAHTPSLVDAQNSGTRRSNSLSDMVDGIRLFEVEGYEETEQNHPIGNSKRPMSFALPADTDKSGAGTDIEAPATSALSSGTISAVTSTGISSLVSRINNIVSTSDAAPKQTSTSFSRPPPMPGYLKPQTRQPATQSSFKITPTTQKYLESLERRQSALPANNIRRLSGD